MLALLSAPRGRVSAARVARVRKHERAGVHPVVIRLPHVPAAAAPDHAPSAPTTCDNPGN